MWALHSIRSLLAFEGAWVFEADTGHLEGTFRSAKQPVSPGFRIFSGPRGPRRRKLGIFERIE